VGVDKVTMKVEIKLKRGIKKEFLPTDFYSRRRAHHDGDDRSEALFYYFRLEDQVPDNHLLRLIEKRISFDFVGERLRDS
jgi:hypothetical protein